MPDAPLASSSDAGAAPPVDIQPLVDILIVNWNSGGQLLDCLRSIVAHGDGLVRRVIVVDNGSVDGSADVDVPDLPLDVVKAGRNLGFGAGCNLAASRSDGRYLLLLNPDAELRAGVLAGAVAHLEAPGNAKVGVVGVRLVGSDGVAHQHCARFPTWRVFVGASLGLHRVTRGAFPPIHLTEFDHLEDRSVDHVMGAFYCIRREIYEAIGGFDEAFFLYLEDVDLSRRVVSAGWRIDYLAGIHAFHKQGGTTEQVKARRLFYIAQSNIVYAWKHQPVHHAIAVTAVTLLGEPVSRTLRAARYASKGDVLATLQGFGMLYAGLPDVVRRVRRARKGARA